MQYVCCMRDVTITTIIEPVVCMIDVYTFYFCLVDWCGEYIYYRHRGPIAQPTNTSLRPFFTLVTL